MLPELGQRFYSARNPEIVNIVETLFVSLKNNL